MANIACAVLVGNLVKREARYSGKTKIKESNDEKSDSDNEKGCEKEHSEDKFNTTEELEKLNNKPLMFIAKKFSNLKIIENQLFKPRTSEWRSDYKENWSQNWWC